MTENERLTFETELGISIDKNEDCPTMSICWNCDIKVKDCKYFNDVVEKLAKYEAIGTVEQLEWCKDASHWKELFKEKLEQYEAIGTVEDIQMIFQLCKDLQVMCGKYHEIGTIEEIKALKEKSLAKKPNEIERKRDEYGFIYQIGKCPCCGKLVTDDRECCDCMQKLDWQ